MARTSFDCLAGDHNKCSSCGCRCHISKEAKDELTTIPAPERLVEALEKTDQLYFDGATYEADKDKVRLTGQLGKIFEYMRDGEWRTLEAIGDATGAPMPSVSTRLRDFRKDRFGAYTVERRRVNDSGLYEYRLVL